MAALANALLCAAAALLVWMVTRILRHPGVRHGLWLLVLLKLVTPPLVDLPILPGAASQSADSRQAGGTAAFPPSRAVARSQPTAQALSTAPEQTIERSAGPAVHVVEIDTGGQGAGAGPATSVAILLPELAQWAAWPWAMGAVVVLLLAYTRIRRFRGALACAIEAPEEEQERVRGVALRLGLRKAPRLELLPGSLSPMFWMDGLRPRLLISKALFERLGTAQREALLAHELAHLVRCDP